MSNRRWRLVALSTAASLLVGTCSSPATSPSSSPTGPTSSVDGSQQPSSSRAAGPATVVFWDTAEEPKQELFGELIAEFEQLNPDVDVQYEFFGTFEVIDRTYAAMGTGTGPTMFEAFEPTLPQFISKGLLAPLDPAAFGVSDQQELIDQYIPGTLDVLMDDQGNLIGLPNQMNGTSLFINNRMFEAAGLDPVADAPKTWDDVAALNEILTVRDSSDRVTKKGFEFRYGAGPYWLVEIFHALMYQVGGSFLDDEGAPVFHEEPGVRALTTWQNLVTAPELTSNTSASPYQDFAFEQNAMDFGGPNLVGVAVALNPSMEGNITAVPLPQIAPDAFPHASYSISFNMVVNGAAPPEDQAAAWRFIAYATSEPERWFKATQMLHPRVGWYETPTAREIPGIDTFVFDLENARPLTDSPNYGVLESALAAAIERVALSGADPAESLAQAAEEFSRNVGG